MNRQTVLQNLRRALGKAGRGAAAFSRAVRNVLLTNLADGILLPRRGLFAAIEEGSSSLAWGYRFLGVTHVAGCGELLPGPPPSPEALAEAVSARFRTKRARAGREIALGFPKAWTVVQKTDLPATVKENLPSAVSFELDRLTPFNAEDAWYDFTTLGERDDRVELTLVAARASAVSAYVRAFAEKGFTVIRVAPNLSAVGALCAHAGGNGAVVYAAVNETSCEGALIRNGVLNSSFYVDIAGAGGEAPAMAECADEIRRQAELASAGGTPPSIYLDAPDRLSAPLAERIGQPVRFLGSMDLKLALPKGETSRPIAALAGLFESLRGRPEPLNLLSRGIHEPSNVPMRVTAALALGALLMGGLLMAAPLKTAEERIAEIDRQIALRKEEVRKVEAVRKEIDRLNQEIKSINGFKKDKAATLDVLKELTGIVPKNTWLTRVKVAGSTVDLEGYGGSATDILPLLETSVYFQKVDFGAPTYRDTRLGSDRFVIKMELEKPAPAPEKGEP